MPGNNRVLICNLAERHFQMCYLLSSSPSCPWNRFRIVGETTQGRSVSFFLPTTIHQQRSLQSSDRGTGCTLNWLVFPCFAGSNRKFHSYTNRPLFRRSVWSHHHGSRIPAWLPRQTAKMEEHFDVPLSLGSVEMLRCHHASKLGRSSEQEKTSLFTEDKKQNTVKPSWQKR